MHIPDGFLGPKTCIACYAAVLPFWVVAWRGLKRRMEFSFEVPYVALASAFIFVLMLFNVPIPGGTSGHAVGTSIVAIALGVGPAILATSFALAVQALIFQDGGITAFGANALNMGAVQALTAAAVWRVLGTRRGQSASPGRIFVGAFAAGYLAAVASAFMTALQLGVQPLIERSGEGLPLYFPLGFSITIPAMLLGHMFVGVLEGAVTGFAIGYLLRTPQLFSAMSNGGSGDSSGALQAPSLFQPATSAAPVPAFFRRKAVWIPAIVLILAVPLGIWLPAAFNASDPWGEWDAQETAARAGLTAAPAGLARLSEVWSAPIPDYGFGASAGTVGESVQYIASAVIGVMVLALLFWGIGAWQRRQVRSTP